MSTETTRRMISVYNQNGSQPIRFLSGFFQSPPQNFHTSEDVEIDIVRGDEDIAVVIQDLTTGYRMNSEDIYTNKAFKPPIFKEAVALNSFDLLKRMPGQNPFASPDYRANVITRMFGAMQKVERKIRRSIEVQASQVMQTGIVTLTDSNGVALYTLDYKPKATHFPTAAVAWGLPAATIEADISSLAEVIRNDGLEDPDQLIMGVDTFEAFIKDTEIQKRYDNRRIDLGTIAPMQVRGNGGSYRGIVEIGHYRYDIWTYGGRYKDPQTGTKISYVDPGSCIVRSSSARLDATFGAIPNIGKEIGGARILPELPGRMTNVEGGMDLFTNAWISNDGEQLFGGIGARPLMMPTAIDTYGNITTGA